MHFALLVQGQRLGISFTYETSSAIIPTLVYQDVEVDYLTSCYKYKPLTPSWNPSAN